MGELHNELKKEFQLERMILFSDAVFAIAITLLVIEIKIPDIPHETVSDKDLLQSLGHLFPKFLGFIVSFTFIGLYWTVHHRMFGYVTGYDRKLLLLNLVFLFFVALMPFSTGFYSEYGGKMFSNDLKVPITFYVLNFCGLGFMNHLMWRHIINPKNGLTIPAVPPDVAKMAKIRSALVPAVFLIMLPIIYLTSIVYAAFVPMLIPITISIIKKITKNNK